MTRNSQYNTIALKTALIYMIIGGLWIIFSDELLQKITSNPHVLTSLQILKGWFFIFITSVILFFFIRKHTKTLTESILEKKALSKNFDYFTKFANDIVLFMNESGKILEANDRALEYYGYSRKEILNLTNVELCPPAYRDYLSEQTGVLNKTTGVVFELPQLRKDGSVFLSEISSRSMVIEGKIFYQSIIRNITERKDSEERIRKLSRAVDQSNTSIIITDKNGIIEYVNPRFTLITGYEREEAVGKKTSFLKSGEMKPEVYKELWNTIISGGEWKGELLNRRKNGEHYWESTSISPIRDNGGETTHYLAIKEDITEQKRITEELIKAKEKAEESDRIKSDFLAQMSHEIRTPLNIILSYTSYLGKELSDENNEDYHKIFSSIDSAGRRLLRTINAILNMSALQSGSIEIHLRKMNLSSLLRNLIAEFETGAENKNLKLHFNCDADNCMVVSDEYIVTEIFQNLIDNSIKYTEKGEINIKVYKDEDDKTYVAVADTGIGISEEYISKIFQPFTQEESGYSRKFEGNGLGLALVNNYIRLIGADIKISSRKGDGTKVTIIFK